MAYTKAWDEAQPDGSENANTIDTEIQDVKISMRERLNQILDSTTAWETDAQDPKLLDGAAFPAGGITYAARASERASVSLSTAETITTATVTAIPWDTEDIDVGGLVDLGTQATRITIVNTGFYLVVGNVNWDAGTTGSRYAQVRRNGSSTIARQYFSAAASPAGANNVSWIGALTAVDYIELEVNHTQGTNLDVLADSITRFSIFRLA